MPPHPRPSLAQSGPGNLPPVPRNPFPVKEMESPMRCPIPLAPLALALVAAACSGGGGTPVQPPTGEVRVLGPNSTRTNSSTTIVRGIATEEQGGVEVAGVAATSDDGFRTWRAEVPLEFGRNELEVVQIAAGGARNSAGTVQRERLRWLFSELSSLRSAPGSDRLVGIGLGLGPDEESYVGTGLDAVVLDLEAGTQSNHPLPIEPFQTAPSLGLFTPMDGGDRAVMRMSGWGRDCQCPIDDFVTVDFAGATSGSIQTPGPFLLASHAIATGRTDELAFTSLDGFGFSSVDGSDAVIAVRAGLDFQPSALCRGPDDSTFYAADQRGGMLWRITRGQSLAEQIAGQFTGSGANLGRVRSLSYAAALGAVLCTGDQGLIRVDTTTLARTSVTGEPELDAVVSVGERAFVLIEGNPEEIDLTSGSSIREPLLPRGLPAGPDWRKTLALDHRTGTDRVAVLVPDGVHWLDLANARAERGGVMPGVTAPAAVDANREAAAWTVPIDQRVRIQIVDFERRFLDSADVDGEALALAFDSDSGALAALVRDPGPTEAARLVILDPAVPGRETILPLGNLPGIGDLVFHQGIAWISHLEQLGGPAPHGRGITRVDVSRGLQSEFGDPPLLRTRLRTLFLDPLTDTMGAVADTSLVLSPSASANWSESSNGRPPQLGIGPSLLAPRAACALRGQSAAVIFDLALGALFHVDLTTGERSIVAL